MSKPIKYTCSCCGIEQEEWPALTYKSPTNYNFLSEEEQPNIAELDSDFCTIKYSDQTDRFIRCILKQKVVDDCQELEYGLWVSLSEKSFQDYKANFDNENHETQYFGWLSNDLSDYDFSESSIPTTVITNTENQRPEIVPHKDFDHPFVHDYYKGITKSEAERRINEMMRIVTSKTDDKKQTKPWWKLW